VFRTILIWIQSMLYGLYQTNKSRDWTFVLDVLFRPINLINTLSDVIVRAALCQRAVAFQLLLWAGVWLVWPLLHRMWLLAPSYLPAFDATGCQRLTKNTVTISRFLEDDFFDESAVEGCIQHGNEVFPGIGLLASWSRSILLGCVLPLLPACTLVEVPRVQICGVGCCSACCSAFFQCSCPWSFWWEVLCLATENLFCHCGAAENALSA